MSHTNNNTVYDGPLAIRKSTHLSIQEQVIEHHFAVELQSDLAASTQAYIKLINRKNVPVLDADKVRSLSTVWNLSKTSQAVFSAAVQRPSTAFTNYLYENTVRENSGGFVVFMAGGGGSGKTLATNYFVNLQPLLVYDTTFSQTQHAFAKVRLALAREMNVLIVYVNRPFQNAVRGVIERAIVDGRTVPLYILARDHVDSPTTVFQVANKFASNNEVQVYVFDNSGNHPNEGKILTDRQEVLSFLEELTYNDKDDFERQAREVLNNEKSTGEIPERIVAALEWKPLPRAV